MTAARAAGYARIRLGPMALHLRPRVLAAGGALTLALLLGALWALMQGSLPVSASEVVRVLAGDRMAPEIVQVVRDIRLPRVLLALLTGAMLGLAGAAMQALTRNGLADPGLIGVKEGASCAVLALILFYPALGVGMRPLAGMAGGLAVALCVVALSRDLSGVRFVLVGIGMSWLLAAGLLIFITTADIRDVETALVWLAGSLHAATWSLLPVTAAWGMVGAALLFSTTRGADAALMGDAVATGLGVRLKTVAALRLAAPVLMTAAAVSAVGSLGFVGLIAPHVARFMVGGGQAAQLFFSMLAGAAMVLAADTAGRLIFAPLQIPAGIVMAIAGVPFFLFLLWRRRDAL